MITIVTNIIKTLLIKISNGLLFSEGWLVSKTNEIIHPNFICTKETKRCDCDRKSPNYRYEFLGKDAPSCCATHLYTILKDVASVLEKEQLEYFISFGTLLGAVRHGGLIPWDTDIDIVIAEKDKNRIFQALQKELGNTYAIREDQAKIVGSLIRVNYSQVNTLHVDIFTYVEKEEDTIVFEHNFHFLKSDIFPLQKIKYYGSYFFAPKDIKKQLTTFYGNDYMEYAYKQWAFDQTIFKIKDFSPAKITEAW